MIQYIPFTYLPEALGNCLTRAIGTLSVWQLSETLTPAHMRTLADTGLLKWRRPVGIDPVQLAQAARSFNLWGELHQSKTGDLSTFYQAAQAAGAPEGSIQQIRSRIRHWGESGTTAADAALFQAALFLCLAHIYDQQQDALAQELGSVKRLEAHFGKILGEADDPEAAVGPCLTPAGDGAADPGLFMTEKRLQAWAKLSAAQADQDGVYVTNSTAVWDHLMALFPGKLPATNLLWQKNRPTVPLKSDELVTLLTSLSQADNPQAIIEERCATGCLLEGGVGLALAVLADTPPMALFNRIRNEAAVPEQSPGGFKSLRHIVLGYLHT